MIFKKAAVAGLTGVVGLVLGLTMGVTGANAVAHHNQDKAMSHSATQNGRPKQGNHKDFIGNQSGPPQGHKRWVNNGDNTQRVQPKSDGTTQQNETPNTNPAPTTK